VLFAVRVGLLDCYCWLFLLLFVMLVFWMIGLMDSWLVGLVRSFARQSNQHCAPFMEVVHR
jgi:hypothetical protein